MSKPTRIASSSCILIKKLNVNSLNNLITGISTVDITDHLYTFLYNVSFFKLVN